MKRYQSVTVGEHAVSGVERSYLDDVVFDVDFAGRSLLDVGCNVGYFCLEATRRGGKAVGIETNRDVWRDATEIAKSLDPRPEYIHVDFERWDAEGRTFDTTIALNVLHHMYEPVHAIRRMMAMTRRKMVLELATSDWRNVKTAIKNPLSRLAPGDAMWVKQAKKNPNVASRTFLFTPQSIATIINSHHGGFEPIRISRPGFKGRMLVEARKRDIGHLIVVAGPTSAGKSTLCAALERDPRMRERFGVDEGAIERLNALGYDALPAGRMDQVVLHYDLLRPFRKSIVTYDRDPCLDLLDVAERVTVITLFASPQRLREQMIHSEFRGGKKEPSSRKKEIFDRYETHAFLEDWYSDWFDRLNRIAGNRVTHRCVVIPCHREFPQERWRDEYIAL